LKVKVEIYEHIKEFLRSNQLIASSSAVIKSIAKYLLNFIESAV